MSKVDVFRSVLESFENESMRLYCIDMIKLMPDYNFTMPSSTTLKYHNTTQCRPGGQSYHVIMVATIMNYILSLEYTKEKYPDPVQRDCLRIAAILHDAQKTEGGQYTAHTHPLSAAEWIKATETDHDINARQKKYIARLIASHSGEWTTSKKSNEVLPKPVTDDQMLVHICDILGSRSNLDMIYTDEQRKAVEEMAGKHQDVPDINAGECKECQYYINPDYTRCHECGKGGDT